MKTSATETRIIAPVRVFPYALALCTSSPGRDCENHQGPNKAHSPWSCERHEDTARQKTSSSLTLSFSPYTPSHYRKFVRGPSLPDLWGPNIRHYLWPKELQCSEKNQFSLSLFLSLVVFFHGFFVSSLSIDLRNLDFYAILSKHGMQRVCQPCRIRQWIDFPLFSYFAGQFKA